MSEKCFCHLNGFAVKDAQARNDIATLNSVASDISSDVTVLGNRMNTFTKLPEGSTTADSELIDIRNGADGVVYTSAGESVRAQFNQKVNIESVVNTLGDSDKKIPTQKAINNLFEGAKDIKMTFSPFNYSFDGDGFLCVGDVTQRARLDEIIYAPNGFEVIYAPNKEFLFTIFILDENKKIISQVSYSEENFYYSEPCYFALSVKKLDNANLNNATELSNIKNSFSINLYPGYVSLKTNINAKNLFNPINNESGKVLSEETGELDDSANHTTSGFIEIEGGKTYTITKQQNFVTRMFIASTWGRVCFYDDNKNFIQSVPVSDSYVAPSNAKYLRFSSDSTSMNNEEIQKFMVAEGTTLLPYSPYDDKFYYHAKDNIDDGIVCWGDSLTYGSGSTSGNTYPEVLSRLTNLNVARCGYPGDDSLEIACAQGGYNFLVNPVTIPATGSVTVEIYDPLFSEGTPFRFPSISAETGINPVNIGGVLGNLGLSASGNTQRRFTFTRVAHQNLPGEVVDIKYPTPIFTNCSKLYKSRKMVLWIGTNGGWNDTPAVLIQQIRKMIEFQSANKKEFIIIGITKGTATERAELEEALTLEFGRNYINMRDYLVKCGLSDSGITATEQDETDIAQGVVPTSLRDDHVHLNDKGYNIVATQVYKRGVELGYWS